MLAMNTKTAMGHDPECSNTNTPLMIVSFSSSKIVRVYITGKRFAGMYKTAAHRSSAAVSARLCGLR